MEAKKDKMLVVDQLTREFPGRTAVDNASFVVHQGSIHGFLGPNGAGKSTTMRMIAGLLTPTKGKIHLLGEELTPTNHALKSKLGILPENPPLYPDMTVEKYLDFVARLHHVTDRKHQVDKVLADLSLLTVRKRLIGNLSKGFKQRVGLAQAMVYDAPFLILDEPMNGLDPEAVVELRDFIKKLAGEKTILFSSHILSEVEQVCDHITIIHQGKIRASGSIQEIHKRFHQGLVVKVGLRAGDKLPDLSRFGKCDIGLPHLVGDEEQYHLSFDDEKDIRYDLARYILESARLMTLAVEPPELEDIFLHMTEKKR